MWLFFVVLLRRPALLAFLLVSLVGFELMFILVYPPSPRHVGYVVLVSMATLWLGHPWWPREPLPAGVLDRVDWGLRRFLVVPLAIVLGFQAALGVANVIDDVRLDYSSSARLASLIAGDPRLDQAIVIGAPETLTQSLPYYRTNRIYLTEEQTFRDWMLVQVPGGRRVDYSLGELLETATALRARYGVPIVMVLGWRLDGSDAQIMYPHAIRIALHHDGRGSAGLPRAHRGGHPAAGRGLHGRELRRVRDVVTMHAEEPPPVTDDWAGTARRIGRGLLAAWSVGCVALCALLIAIRWCRYTSWSSAPALDGPFGELMVTDGQVFLWAWVAAGPSVVPIALAMLVVGFHRRLPAQVVQRVNGVWGLTPAATAVLTGAMLWLHYAFDANPTIAAFCAGSLVLVWVFEQPRVAATLPAAAGLATLGAWACYGLVLAGDAGERLTVVGGRSSCSRPSAGSRRASPDATSRCCVSSPSCPRTSCRRCCRRSCRCTAERAWAMVSRTASARSRVGERCMRACRSANRSAPATRSARPVASSSTTCRPCGSPPRTASSLPPSTVVSSCSSASTTRCRPPCRPRCTKVTRSSRTRWRSRSKPGDSFRSCADARSA
jgi:hypothetical protein